MIPGSPQVSVVQTRMIASLKATMLNCQFDWSNLSLGPFFYDLEAVENRPIYGPGSVRNFSSIIEEWARVSFIFYFISWWWVAERIFACDSLVLPVYGTKPRVTEELVLGSTVFFEQISNHLKLNIFFATASWPWDPWYLRLHSINNQGK